MFSLGIWLREWQGNYTDSSVLITNLAVLSETEKYTSNRPLFLNDHITTSVVEDECGGKIRDSCSNPINQVSVGLLCHVLNIAQQINFQFNALAIFTVHNIYSSKGMRKNILKCPQ